MTQRLTLLRKLDIAWAYKRTLWHILVKKGLKHLYNYLYAKIVVLTGEGAGGLMNFIQVPLYRRFPELSGLPRQIEVEQNNHCPMKCVMCETTYWNEQPRDRTFEEFKNLIDQLPLRWVNMSGIGEPFLNPDYLNNLEYAKSKGIFVNIVDDFRLVNEKVARFLIDIGVDSFWISIDGATEETYRKMRPNFRLKQVLSNIRRFIEIKKEMRSPVPEICFRFVVSKVNVHEMPKFVELIASLGTRKDFGPASRIEFVGILSFPEIEWLYLPEIPYEIIKETCRKAKELDVLVTFFHAQEKNMPDISDCIAWTEPYITVNGWVVPCCAVLMANDRDFLRQYSFGNVLEQRFEDIWYHPYYKWFRKAVMDKNSPVPAFCKGCRAYKTKHRERLHGVDYRRRN